MTWNVFSYGGRFIGTTDDMDTALAYLAQGYDVREMATV